MLKKFKKIAVFFMVISIAAMLYISAEAVSGFSVNLAFPDNQRQNGNSFFDLLVYPGMEQELTIEITNTSDMDATMLVEVITASTSMHGEIDYITQGGLMDETLKFSIEDIIELPDNPVIVPAGETTEVSFKLTVPEESFDGILLGGISIVREVTQEEREAAGAIVNQFGYVSAVRLAQSESAEDITANFALGDITAELVHHRASIVAQIRNTEPKFIRGASATMEIFPQGSRTSLFKHEIGSLEMAPNSIFSYSFVDHDGYGIEAGDYTAILTLTYDDETWSWERNFTITPEQAESVNAGAINLVNDPGPTVTISWWDDIPQWAIIASVGVLLLALLTIIMMILAVKSNKKYKKACKQMVEQNNLQPEKPNTDDIDIQEILKSIDTKELTDFIEQANNRRKVVIRRRHV